MALAWITATAMNPGDILDVPVMPNCLGFDKILCFADVQNFVIILHYFCHDYLHAPHATIVVLFVILRTASS